VTTEPQQAYLTLDPSASEARAPRTPVGACGVPTHRRNHWFVVPWSSTTKLVCREDPSTPLTSTPRCCREEEGLSLLRVAGAC